MTKTSLAKWWQRSGSLSSHPSWTFSVLVWKIFLGNMSNIFNIVCRLFVYLHSLTLLDISSVTWMLLPWIMEFFRCERYHSFCTLSIPAFLRTSSLSLNSSKQTKTGLGNKKHENWMTRKLNVRKLELYLKEQWFYCWNKMYCTVNWFERGIFLWANLFVVMS